VRVLQACIYSKPGQFSQYSNALWTTGPRNRGSIIGRGKNFYIHSVQTYSEDHAAPYSLGPGERGFFLRGKATGT
jgi:hypothetical protein